MNEYDRIKKVINEQLGIDEKSISVDTSFVDDLGADSLDIAELIMGFESEFDLEIPESAADSIVTVGDALNYIKENIA